MTAKCVKRNIAGLASILHVRSERLLERMRKLLKESERHVLYNNRGVYNF